MQKIFALVDCNNFYVSCERVFNPALAGTPVVVLSNNDGCIIARSNEAKKLGIRMGSPFFQCREIINDHQVKVFSSNYALYGDMSRRVMHTLLQFSPELEIYSIDEAFISLDGFSRSGLSDYARQMRSKVMAWTGIPVSIGIGPTKVLAKAANKLAKKGASHKGVFNVMGHPQIDELLESIEVEAVWGIGRRYASFLNRCGITTARRLKYAADGWVRKNLTVAGLRIVWELRGISCLALEDAPPPKKGIGCSRSFGREVDTLDELNEAVSSYVSRAAEKLREQASIASFLHVYLTTGTYKNGPHYSNTATCRLPAPTAYTPCLITHAKRVLRKLYRPGCRYQKVGVFLTGMLPHRFVQYSLFSNDGGRMSLRDSVTEAVDCINEKWGRSTVRFAAAGIAQGWRMCQSKRSPNFTTRWDELPVVKTGAPSFPPE